MIVITLGDIITVAFLVILFGGTIGWILFSVLKDFILSRLERKGIVHNCRYCDNLCLESTETNNWYCKKHKLNKKLIMGEDNYTKCECYKENEREYFI